MKKDRFPDLERRKFTRLKDNILVLYYLESRPFAEFKAITRNISPAGLMFETDRNIFKESKLKLEIYQPTSCYKNMFFCIPVLAKIIWVSEIEKDNFEKGENKYRVGVEFVEIKEEDKEKIANYVKEVASEE